jgi:hypothetical protein
VQVFGCRHAETNHAFDNSTVLQAWGPWTAGGRAALDQVIQIPLVPLLRSAPPG